MPTLPTIETIQSSVVNVVSGNAKVKKAYLFGSFARGEADAGSDVDISLDTENGFGLTEACGIRLDLCDRLGRSIDVTAVPTEKNTLLFQEFERDKVLLYER
jgi:predicted nucleotidyltransferase